MNHLKLVINNINKKKDVFFKKSGGGQNARSLTIYLRHVGFPWDVMAGGGGGGGAPGT